MRRHRHVGFVRFVECMRLALRNRFCAGKLQQLVDFGRIRKLRLSLLEQRDRFVVVLALDRGPGFLDIICLDLLRLLFIDAVADDGDERAQSCIATYLLVRLFQ